MWPYIVIGVASIIVSFIVSVTIVGFVNPFYSTKKTRAKAGDSLPDEGEYAKYMATIRRWDEEAAVTPHEDVSIKSFDGLTLRGKYYELSKDSPVEIMFHGYRGSAKRDMSGGIKRAFAVGHSVILVDQRGCGRSEGHVISFGINESRDCLEWIKMANEKFGTKRKIILTGISMGASTVLITSGKDLPENVVGVLADCGFSSAKAIIYKIVSEMKISPKIFYPFVKLGGMVFGRFNVDETSAVEAVKNCKIPVLFVHGEKDEFVPVSMGEQNFNACAAPKKKFVVIKGAGHGVAFPAAPEEYIAQVKEFFSYVHEDNV